ncbi:hypothetical protein CBP36_21270 (plasmid) [Acidovorax carolinensis]|uniref:Pilus assembly protein PilO n=1 Tax=Acidovorax carolinensis TaxID=553814 RepID=A0A240UKF3_9BURK|nr:type 4b pilus protein PilO2 [Acidovorax carolinensis]ART61500.1 hypothetical protein CBP36_21270 [Acidovorax carolinensis]
MAHIVQIGKRRWLLGMTWASYEDVPHKSELREDAQRLSATWTSLRVGEDCVQGGFCSAVEGAKVSGLYSLAAMLADSRKQPWLGIFRIHPEQDLWWYVAVRDGHAILPDGDVVGGREEIVAARERHSGYTDWNYVEGQGIGDLETLIKEVNERPTPVRSLEKNPHLPAYVAAAVVGVTAATGGYWWWQQHQIAEAAARRAAMERMREQINQGAPVNLQAAPTAAMTIPHPDDVLQACGNAILHLPIAQDGWLFDKVSCDSSTATVVWARKDGATVEFRPSGDLSADGDAVTQTIPLRLEQRSRDDRIRLREAEDRLRSWAQAASFKLNLRPAPQPTVLPGSDPTQITQAQPTTSVAIDIKVSPFGLDLSDIPGLRLTGIQNVGSGAGWQLTGELYGR